MYHYRECGLRNVWLANGFEQHETPYGPGVAEVHLVAQKAQFAASQFTTLADQSARDGAV